MYPFYLGIDLNLKRTYMVLMDTKYVQICESPFLILGEPYRGLGGHKGHFGQHSKLNSILNSDNCQKVGCSIY